MICCSLVKVSKIGRKKLLDIIKLHIYLYLSLGHTRRLLSVPESSGGTLFRSSSEYGKLAEILLI